MEQRKTDRSWERNSSHEDGKNAGADDSPKIRCRESDPRGRYRVADQPPSVSILIPTYRRPVELKRALTSIVEQKSFSYSNVEVIVWEDGSGARYDEPYRVVVEQFKNSVKFYSNDVNVGMARNLINLAEAASSDYCLILTDDDILAPDALGRLLKLCVRARRKGVWFVHTPRNCVSESGSLITVAGFVLPLKISRSPVGTALSLCRKNYVLSGTLVRTHAIRSNQWAFAVENAYFPLAISFFAISAGDVLLAPSSLVKHTVNNETHWHRWGATTNEQEQRLLLDLLILHEALRDHAIEMVQGSVRKRWLRLIFRRNIFGTFLAAAINDPSLDRGELVEILKTRGRESKGSFELFLALLLRRPLALPGKLLRRAK